MHLDESSDPEALSGPCVDKLITLAELSLIDSDVGQLAVASVLKLECEHDRSLLVIRLKDNLFLVVIKVQCPVLNIPRLRQVLSHTVEKGLDALVLVSGSHKDRAHLERKGPASDCGLDHLNGRLLSLEDHVHEIIVEVTCALNKLLTLLLGLLEH